MLCEWIRFGKPSVLGIVTGMVAGLGTITPASGFVGPLGALAIGITAGIVCFLATNYMKRKLNVDDSLDVFPVHGVGYAGGATVTMGQQVLIQLVGVGVTLLWSGVLTFVILKAVDLMTGLRVSVEEETEGLDTAQHNETGYNL